MKYNVFTRIEGVKQYVRRTRISAQGRTAVTMLCTSQSKAKDFYTEEKVNAFIKSVGIGWIKEIN